MSRKELCRWMSFAGFAGLQLGCSPGDDGFVTPSSGFFPTPVVSDSVDAPVGAQVALYGEVVDNPSRPMVTGTLAVTADGAFAVAADSERDKIVTVKLSDRSVAHVPLSSGDEPGRTIAGRSTDTEQHAYVVLRGASAVVDLAVESGRMERIATCQAPRGLAYDADNERVHVACATGELVTYDAKTWEKQRHLALPRDLRDVVVTKSGLLVSRFRSAELLVVDETGMVTWATKPAVAPACAEPVVAHRLVASGFRLVVAFQQASSSVVWGRSASSHLGDDSGCEVAQSAPVVLHTSTEQVATLNEAAVHQTYWSDFGVTDTLPLVGEPESTEDEPAHFAARLRDSAGPMDVAVSGGGRVVASLAGNHWTTSLPTLVTWHDNPEAKTPTVQVEGHRPSGMITSVALDSDEHWLAQSREPAGLVFEDGTQLFFGGVSVNSTAYSLFHMNSGAGVSCASCHPEGGDDEHVWHFPRGFRRTLPLGGGLSSQGPYNWDHATSTMTQLLEDVLGQQMSYDSWVLDGQASALAEWISELSAPSPGVIVDVDAVESGRTLFAATTTNCQGCHSGVSYADGQVHDVGTNGAFATPSLLGVGARTQLLHDGCAQTLRDVFGACGGEGQSPHRLADKLADVDIEHLVAFLATL